MRHTDVEVPEQQQMEVVTNSPDATRRNGLKTRTGLHAILVLALALSTTTLPVVAQEADESEDAQEEGRDIFDDEIVVTAEKREQVVTEVPITIQVADGDYLDTNSVKNLRDLVDFIPGATQGGAFSSAQARYQIRGIPQEVGDPTVGYYIGEAAFYYPGMIFAPIIRTVGLERVEVLKGPQSTLYGNGAMGGVIRVIPKEPNFNRFDGSVRAGYDTIEDGGDGHSIDATISFPFGTDKVGARLSVGDDEVGGWVDLQPFGINFATFGFEPSGPPIEDAGGQETSDLQLHLTAQPSDRLSLKLMGIANESQITPTGFLLLEPEDPPTSTDADPALSYNDTEYNLYSGSVSYELSGATLTSSFTKIDFEDDWTSSFILTFGLPTIVLQEVDAFSNETRLVSNSGGRLQWLAGLFYVDSDQVAPVVIPEFPLLGVPRVESVADIQSEQISVFGEMSYELIEGKLTGLVGLRYFQDDRIFSETSNIFPIPIPTIEREFDSVNPRFNLSYTPKENSLFFFNAAKGFRSGAANTLSVCLSIPPDNPLAATCPETIDSDELWSYEVGSKQVMASGQVVLDTSLYFQDWQDLQGAVRAGTVTASFPLGDADGFGVDFGLSLTPSSLPGFRTQISANWNNMEFSSLDPSVRAGFAGFVNVGDELPTVAPFSSNVSFQYFRELSSSVYGDLALTWNHVDEHISAPGSFIGAEERDYVNFRAGVWINDRFGIHLVGSNLTDEGAVIWGQAGPLYAADTRIIETPRSYGIELSLDF